MYPRIVPPATPLRMPWLALPPREESSTQQRSSGSVTPVQHVHLRHPARCSGFPREYPPSSASGPAFTSGPPHRHLSPCVMARLSDALLPGSTPASAGGAPPCTCHHSVPPARRLHHLPHARCQRAPASATSLHESSTTTRKTALFFFALITRNLTRLPTRSSRGQQRTGATGVTGAAVPPQAAARRQALVPAASRRPSHSPRAARHSWSGLGLRLRLRLALMYG